MDHRQNILKPSRQNQAKTGARIQMSSFDDDRDPSSAATVDEHTQVAGSEIFYSLRRNINNLDKELRNFANAARQLGSSVAILSSSYQLRERLAQLLFLYQENAAKLFPKKINRVAEDSVGDSPTTTSRRRRKGKTQLLVPRPTVSENLSLERFPEQLENLADDVTNFLRTLNEFPEFTDEAVNASIMNFEADLRHWASCLKEHAGQFELSAVQRYIHDLSTDMGEHLVGLSSSLSMFIEVGVPTIRFAQEHGANNLLNLSTVAVFFSVVTATMIQVSYQLPRGDISDSVNTLWFASMVFSIAASVNSLVGLTWKQAMYRSPGHRVPWWVLIWIKRSPFVFLVLSVACFSVGFCCFAYASRQAYITSVVTTVLTTFTSFGLTAVLAWLAFERWAFARHKGQKWLSDVLLDFYDHFVQNSRLVMAIVWLLRSLIACLRYLFVAVYKNGRWRSARRQRGNDLESNAVVDINLRYEDEHSMQLQQGLQIPIATPPNPASPIRNVKVDNPMLGEETPVLPPGAAFFDSPQSTLVSGGRNEDFTKPVYKRTTSSGPGRIGGGSLGGHSTVQASLSSPAATCDSSR